MDVQQASTQPQNAPVVTAQPVETKSAKPLITPQQDAYIAFVATGGLLPTEGGEYSFKKMTADEFARELGVERTTLYYWRNHIQDFWGLVDLKRKEIGGKDRLSRVWNGVFLRAAAGNPQAAALYLANFDPNFKMPNEKADKETMGSLLDVLEKARETGRKVEGIIEGEVVGEGQSTNS